MTERGDRGHVDDRAAALARACAGRKARIMRYMAVTLRSKEKAQLLVVGVEDGAVLDEAGAVEEHVDVGRAAARQRQDGAAVADVERARSRCPRPRGRRASPRRCRWRARGAPSRGHGERGGPADALPRRRDEAAFSLQSIHGRSPERFPPCPTVPGGCPPARPATGVAPTSPANRVACGGGPCQWGVVSIFDPTEFRQVSAPSPREQDGGVRGCRRRMESVWNPYGCWREVNGLAANAWPPCRNRDIRRRSKVA